MDVVIGPKFGTVHKGLRTLALGDGKLVKQSAARLKISFTKEPAVMPIGPLA